MYKNERSIELITGHITIAFLLILVILPTCVGQSDEETKIRIQEAFTVIQSAEERGGNVSGLVNDLNRALELLDEGEVEEAENLALDVIKRGRAAGEAGARAEMWSHFRAGLVVALLLGLSVLVWVYGSEVFWAVWVWLKRNWVVKG